MWVQSKENYYNTNWLYYDIPPNAVVVSMGVESRYLGYLGRVQHNNDLRLGVVEGARIDELMTVKSVKFYLFIDEKKCLIDTNNIEVLVLPSYSWKPTQDGKILVGAVPFGYSTEGHPLYIARKVTDSGVWIGQVNSKNGMCYFPQGNQSTSAYECLIVDDNVENMQIPPAKSNIEGELLNIINTRFSKLDIKHEETANMINEMRIFSAKIYEMYENISKSLETLKEQCEEVGTILNINSDQQVKQNTKDAPEVTVKIRVDNIGKSCVEEFPLTKTEENLGDEKKPENI